MVDHLRKSALIIATLSVQLGVSGQNLLPSIGLTSLPADNASICPIPTYLDPDGTYLSPAYQIGDTVNDFTLYDLTGSATELSTVMQDGKPVLLISGSYTCPVFRNRIPQMNQLYSAYGSQINMFILYCVEAHPDVDISPYFGYVNINNSNITQGILYRQPTTYGERKALVSDMLSAMNIQLPVLIDGPCNAWWQTYALAPNNAVLIDTDGTVFGKHGWFNRSPHHIVNDVDSILGNVVTPPDTATGDFSFVLTSDSIEFGVAGTTITVHGRLYADPQFDTEVRIERLVENIPSGWATSICTGSICLPPTANSTTVIIPAGGDTPYVMYFYTDSIPASGDVLMRFTDVYDGSVVVEQRFYANTLTVGINGVSKPSTGTFHPNPIVAGGSVNWSSSIPRTVSTVMLTDLLGNRINLKHNGTSAQVPSTVASGTYVAHVLFEDGSRMIDRIVVLQAK